MSNKMSNNDAKKQEIRYSTTREGIVYRTLVEEDGTRHSSWTAEFEKVFFKKHPLYPYYNL